MNPNIIPVSLYGPASHSEVWQGLAWSVAYPCPNLNWVVLESKARACTAWEYHVLSTKITVRFVHFGQFHQTQTGHLFTLLIFMGPIAQWAVTGVRRSSWAQLHSEPLQGSDSHVSKLVQCSLWDKIKAFSSELWRKIIEIGQPQVVAEIIPGKTYKNTFFSNGYRDMSVTTINSPNVHWTVGPSYTVTAYDKTISAMSFRAVMFHDSFQV